MEEEIEEVMNFKEFIHQGPIYQQMFAIAPSVMFSAYVAGNMVAEEECRPVSIMDALKRVMADLGDHPNLPSLDELLEDTSGEAAMRLDRILAPGVVMFLVGEIEKFEAADKPGVVH